MNSNHHFGFIVFFFRRLFDRIPLINPFLDSISLCLSSSLDIFWIKVIIWFSQIEMMSCSVHIENYDIRVSNIIEDTTCSPWVKIAITENNIGDMSKIFLWVSSTEVIKSPVELRIQAFVLVAVLDEGLWVPEWLEEHISLSTLGNWHYHFITYLEIPSIRIEIILLSLLISSSNIQTLKSTCVINKYVINVLDYCDKVKVRLWLGSVIHSFLYSKLHWIAWQVSYERSRIGIVDHRHCTNAVWENSL